MVTWKNKKFYIDGEPFQIYGGSIHYFRSMPDKWYDLLLKLKNCGLNTVETYCPWNLHEPRPGEYDFSGRLDLERFIETAAELGIYVILRPGPYICAEWDFGGLPAWLLADKNMRVRTDEGEYLNYVKRYFDHLMPRILPHLQTKGGNVILMAVENEYGSFGNSTQYMNKCADMIKGYGIDIPIFTSDGHSKLFLDGGHADDCLCAVDFGYSQGEIYEAHTADLDARQPQAPWLHIEFWIGMFTQWGEPAQSYAPEYVAKEVRKHLEKGMNFVFYMFHGGTNFGFTSGANVFNRDLERPLYYRYYSDTTSYDYDALLNEWGEVTPKYLAVQQVMSEHLGITLPKPEPVPVMALGDIPLTEAGELFENLVNIGEHHTSSYLHHMEYYGQNMGYILYRTKIENQNAISYLAVNGVADIAHVYFNGIYRGTLHRNDEETYLPADWMIDGGTLDILVENQGRVNFGAAMHMGDRKGILGNVVMQGVGGPGQNIFNWDVYTLPMDDLSKLVYADTALHTTDNTLHTADTALYTTNNTLYTADTALQTAEDTPDRPMFYKGTFKAEEKKDCFIHLENFEKGFVTVNGFNLGRYWNIGPQQSLYLPAALLKEENEIIVFDVHPTVNPVVSIRDYHVLDSMKTDKGPETIM